MNAEQRKKQIEEQLTEVRRKASALQEAIDGRQAGEDRRAAQRTFAAPKTSEEAEGDFPTLEQLAEGYRTEAEREGRPRIKTKEEILRDGSLVEKLRLFFSSRDLEGYFNSEGTLTKDEKIMIADAVREEEGGLPLYRKCTKESYVVTKYGEQLRYFFKRFQTSFSILANLLNRWDSYRLTAEQMTKLYAFMEEPALDIRDIKEEEPEDRGEARKAERLQAVARSMRVTFRTLEGARLKFDKATETFSVDVGGKDGIYAQIKEEAKIVKEDLADFKAFAVVVEDYIRKSTLRFMPISIQMCIENAEQERYARYLVRNLSYFRSELNERRARGEDPTKEDERTAVIPDYFEVKPSRRMYASCKIYIKQLLDITEKEG